MGVVTSRLGTVLERLNISPPPRELPILFSAPMVRAILAGRKFQTRRLFRLPPWLAKRGADLSRAFPDKAYGVTPCLKVPYGEDGAVERVRNPWGFPEPGGVRLWVRETWGAADRFYQGHDLDEPRVVAYQADKSAVQWSADPARAIPADDRDTWNWGSIKWKPSIHMPRWMSRITLEVTDVRCERLLDISEDDARAEGCQDGANDPRELFECTWDSLNGKRAPWASNPWIWAVSFSRVTS